MTMTTPGQVRTGTQRHSHTDSWMGWRKFMTLIGGLAITWPYGCYAQQSNPAPPKRVGVLAFSRCMPGGPVARRLAELGWIEGRTIVFDCVSTVGRLEQLQALARELVSRRPDVLMAAMTNLVMALKQETTTIPIVMLSTWDPERHGLIASLARPGGNVTGVAWFESPKQLDFLKEIIPHLRRVAIIGSKNPSSEEAKYVEEYKATATSALGLDLQGFTPVAASDYDEIFARIAADHFDAAAISADAFANENLTRIVELALRYRIPTASAGWGSARAGLLLSYGQNALWGFVRGAEYVDQILRGAKPSDLAVEQAAKLELAINLKTAKTLGLTVPPSLLARADEVIE